MLNKNRVMQNVNFKSALTNKILSEKRAFKRSNFQRIFSLLVIDSHIRSGYMVGSSPIKAPRVPGGNLLGSKGSGFDL
jgi:hypothetical protein